MENYQSNNNFNQETHQDQPLSHEEVTQFAKLSMEKLLEKRTQAQAGMLGIERTYSQLGATIYNNRQTDESSYLSYPGDFVKAGIMTEQASEDHAKRETYKQQSQDYTQLIKAFSLIALGEAVSETAESEQEKVQSLAVEIQISLAENPDVIRAEL